MTPISLVLGVAVAGAALAQESAISRVQDPVTGRRITWYRSAHHETHHYYDISPWDPQGERILFFRFDESISTLTAAGRFPGSLWVMNVDGTGRKRVAAGIIGNYHTGANQFWGPNGSTVYFSGGGGDARQTTVVDLATLRQSKIAMHVAANRASPDFRSISCVAAREWGLYHIADGRYERLVTRERVIDLSPNKDIVRASPSALQNTRFNPLGGQILIVHRTTEDFPKLVEMFLYDFASRRLKHLAADLHHPGWRPDGKAILFVRASRPDYFQSIYEVDLETGLQTRLTRDHVPAGHPSYHPRKPYLIVTDCYGGPLGNGLALIDTRTGKIQQLVTIPRGARPEAPADSRFPFRNWGIWIPQRRYLNEPRPAWNADGSKILFTSEESGRMNLYVVDTSDL